MSHHLNITDNIAFDSDKGIYIYSDDYTTLKNNVIYNMTEYGVKYYLSNHNTLDNNFIENC